mmetsp:Transcript_20079/g.42097  ORF Transcript_20079/g.42097 Transcript_20079/m.42097 type:complete len:97 (+) Transcript_20079:70-360(+)
MSSNSNPQFAITGSQGCSRDVSFTRCSSDLCSSKGVCEQKDDDHAVQRAASLNLSSMMPDLDADFFHRSMREPEPRLILSCLSPKPPAPYVSSRKK